ncbi:hypothetical protein F11_12040 [Rhodospirillum rubrum F11]|nr:hypothetical protein F11_12040 [Rhodospirillum rubrum F11]MBK5954755.1 hypothetical protein [Rhodospirillum rubrum]HCF16811.1 hypothetical protein [Rhodospirillum rubrum]
MSAAILVRTFEKRARERISGLHRVGEFRGPVGYFREGDVPGNHFGAVDPSPVRTLIAPSGALWWGKA